MNRKRGSRAVELTGTAFDAGVAIDDVSSAFDQGEDRARAHLDALATSVALALVEGDGSDVA